MPEQSQNVPDPVGIGHFLRFMREGQPEWALFAVKAPIEDVSTAFAEFRSPKKRVVNVPHRGPTGNIDIAFLTAVVRTRGNPWTLVFRSLTDIDVSHLRRVPEEAKTLSERLATRAVTFFAEDASAAMGYEIFERGQSLERADWEADELKRFESTLRQKPALQTDSDKFVDDVFRAEGIYVPCCYPQSDSQTQWLVVEDASAEAVQRADLIDTGEVTTVGEAGGYTARQVGLLTIALYLVFLVWAAWLIFRCFTLGWTAGRVVLLSVALLGFVICRGKWRMPGQVRKGDENDKTTA